MILYGHRFEGGGAYRGQRSFRAFKCGSLSKRHLLADIGRSTVVVRNRDIQTEIHQMLMVFLTLDDALQLDLQF